MKYRYPPIYKYLLLFLCIFMFTEHLNIVSSYKNLFITIAIILMIAALDYILIDNECENFVDDVVVRNEDINDIINNYNIDDDLEDLDNNVEVNYPQQKAFYQLPTDSKQPSYDLNVDCYRRGDGRGGNKNVELYYEKDIF